MALFGNHHYNDFDDDEICSGKYKCPECGWVGDESDLTYSDKNHILVCPSCIEWYGIEVSPDIIKEK